MRSCGSERRGRIKGHGGKIQAIEGIETVNYGGDSALMFVQALNSVRFGGAILVAGLSALAIFLIANTIKLTIYARSNEIAIMRGCGRDERFYPGAVCGGRNDYRSVGRDHSDLVYDLWLYLYL